MWLRMLIHLVASFTSGQIYSCVFLKLSLIPQIPSALTVSSVNFVLFGALVAVCFLFLLQSWELEQLCYRNSPGAGPDFSIFFHTSRKGPALWFLEKVKAGGKVSKLEHSSRCRCEEEFRAALTPHHIPHDEKLKTKLKDSGLSNSDWWVPLTVSLPQARHCTKEFQYQSTRFYVRFNAYPLIHSRSLLHCLPMKLLKIMILFER